MPSFLSAAILLFFARPTAATQPAAPILSASVQSESSIQWSWTTPANCAGALTYTLINSNDGTIIFNNSATSVTENFGDPANTAYVRAVKLTDTACTTQTGPLSASVTAYTFANPVTSLSSGGVTQTAFVASWDTANNTSFTRYELSLAPNNFTSSISTPVAVSQNLTSSFTALTSLVAGSTYYYRVRAFNGRASDGSGAAFSNFSLSNVVYTQPISPTLTGAALSTGSIQWSWTKTTGAIGYRLYESDGGPLLIDTPKLSYSSGTLNANAVYGAVVYAYNSAGLLSPAATTFAYPFARVPLTPTVSKVFMSSVTMVWDPDGNAAGTTYELFTAVDSNFSATVSTVTVAVSTAQVASLLPGTTYFFRLRAINGGQITTAFAVPDRSTVTAANASIAQSSAPPTPYSDLANVIGLWHFDTNTGPLTPDSSVYGGSATLTCLDAACVSSPTFVAGPPFLGSAASLPGLTNSLVSIPDPNPAGAPFNFAGSFTVGAWVNPGSTILSDGSGIVVKGNKAGEDFSLEATSAKTYRFLIANNAAAVTSTSTLVAGQWVRLVGVYDNASFPAQPALRLYVNGILTSSTTTGVPFARVNNAHEIAIGAKQSCAACAQPYDLAFKGKIDEVRFLNVALTDAQVLADYQSASTSTVVAPLPGSPIQVFLPPNAFGAAATIFVSTDPLVSPIRPESSGFLQQGLANLPTGHILIPGSLFEIVPIVNGAPFSATLGSSATISIPYDDDGAGNVAGLLPPVAASSLVLYTLDTAVLRWSPLSTTVDTAAHRIYAATPHFSLFGGLGVSTVGTSLTQIFAYPTPWKIGTKTKFDATALTFANLPADGLIRIFTVSGELVKMIPFRSSDAGRATWDGANIDGKPVGSGVYLAYVQVGATSTGKTIKIAIEK